MHWWPCWPRPRPLWWHWGCYRRQWRRPQRSAPAHPHWRSSWSWKTAQGQCSSIRPVCAEAPSLSHSSGRWRPRGVGPTALSQGCGWHSSYCCRFRPGPGSFPPLLHTYILETQRSPGGGLHATLWQQTHAVRPLGPLTPPAALPALVKTVRAFLPPPPGMLCWQT